MDVVLNKYETNIAIIDSGIDTNNYEFSNNIIGGVGFEYDIKTGNVIKTLDYEDENGHGTSCAAIIKREVEEAGMFIIKILNKDCSTHSKALIEALKCIAEIDNIRLVNLSVATTKELYKDELKEICDLLYDKGKILVSSLENRSDRSYPSVFKNVIGVRGKRFDFSGDYWYDSKSQIQCVSDYTPVLVPSINNSYRLFGSNSKSTPLMAGRIAKILNEKPNTTFEELEMVIEQNAVRNYWSEEDLFGTPIMPKDIPKEKYSCFKSEIDTLASIIANTFEMDNTNISLLYNNENLRHSQIGLTFENCYDLIKNIEKEFKIKLNYNSINLYTFLTIYSLFDFVQEEMKNVQGKG